MIKIICQKCGQMYEIKKFNTHPLHLTNREAREKAKAKKNASNYELLMKAKCPKCRWNNLLNSYL